MKRIQAQRKFAQGAPIPSNTYSISEGKVENVIPIKEESRNIVHNKTPAKTFLDFISFNQIHEHRVPVVVLERLRTNPTNPYIINQKIEELEGSIEPVLIVNSDLNKHAMCLRSYIRNKNKNDEESTSPEEPDLPESNTEFALVKEDIFESVITCKEKETDIITIESGSTTPMNLSSTCNLSDDSADEDTPLAHFAAKKKGSSINKTKRLNVGRTKLNILKKSQSLKHLINKRSYRSQKTITRGYISKPRKVSILLKSKNKVISEVQNKRNLTSSICKQSIPTKNKEYISNTQVTSGNIGILSNSQNSIITVVRIENDFSSDTSEQSTQTTKKEHVCTTQIRPEKVAIPSNFQNNIRKNVENENNLSSDTSESFSQNKHKGSNSKKHVLPGKFAIQSKSKNKIVKEIENEKILTSDTSEVFDQTRNKEYICETKVIPANVEILSKSQNSIITVVRIESDFNSDTSESSTQAKNKEYICKTQVIPENVGILSETQNNMLTKLEFDNNFTSDTCESFGQAGNNDGISQIQLTPGNVAIISESQNNITTEIKMEKDISEYQDKSVNQDVNIKNPSNLKQRTSRRKLKADLDKSIINEFDKGSYIIVDLADDNSDDESPLQKKRRVATPSAPEPITRPPLKKRKAKILELIEEPEMEFHMLCNSCLKYKNTKKIEDYKAFIISIENLLEDCSACRAKADTICSNTPYDLWKELFSLDLDILPKPNEHLLRLKLCTRRRTGKSKPLLYCSLIPKTAENSNASCNKYPKVILEYLQKNFKIVDQYNQVVPNSIVNKNPNLDQKSANNTSDTTNRQVNSERGKNINTQNENSSVASDKQTEHVEPIKSADKRRNQEMNEKLLAGTTQNQPSTSKSTVSTDPADNESKANRTSIKTSNTTTTDINNATQSSIPRTINPETLFCDSTTDSSNKTRSNTTPDMTQEAGKSFFLAPVFTPSAAEFSDPVAYFDSIMPTASKFGICKVVPPADFKPSYDMYDEMVFNATDQYIARLFCRWGPGSKEMSTIKAYLASQSVVFKRAPLYEGMEVNLPKLYRLVQRHGGLKKVIERKRWSRVAEEMRFTKGANPEKKLDQLYVKYLLPYDTLSIEERCQIMSGVERVWSKKYRKMMERAFDPLHRQKKLLIDSDCSDEEDEEEEEEEEDSDDDEYITRALADAEECIAPGRRMNLNLFKKVASTALDTFFSTSTYPTPAEVEEEYWRLIMLGADHLCVNSASIDTGTIGYGFTKDKLDDYGDHPWNLKMLADNSGNVLRFLGPVLGVTVPTLHLGMVFSTSCWHRDPHGLPWMEYMHSGPPKIWYGIPDEQSHSFRKAVEYLCPTSCQNKSIWLPSDIAMIPPNLLLQHNVSLSRVEQNPGEYIIVFPKAYSCSISTGYTVSESVYFASMTWLKNGLQCFLEAQANCEPTMISIDSLLLAIVTNLSAPVPVLDTALTKLNWVLNIERKQRFIIQDELHAADLAGKRPIMIVKHRPGTWNMREYEECEYCRRPLFLSRVRGLTKNNTSLCLEHAIIIIQKKYANNSPMPPFVVEYYYKMDDLDLILQNASRHLYKLEMMEHLRRFGLET